MPSREFALTLLQRKFVAIAPGSAFDTRDLNPNPNQNTEQTKRRRIHSGNNFHLAESLVDEVSCNAESFTGISKFVDYDRISNSFCRVSFANSKENVLEGISRICDLLDALKDSHQ